MKPLTKYQIELFDKWMDAKIEVKALMQRPEIPCKELNNCFKRIENIKHKLERMS